MKKSAVRMRTIREAILSRGKTADLIHEGRNKLFHPEGLYRLVKIAVEGLTIKVKLET
jgi:hypothetical protein